MLGLDQDFFCAAAKAGLVTGHQVASGAAEDLLAKLCAVCPSVCDARDELVPEGWTRAAYGCAHPDPNPNPDPNPIPNPNPNPNPTLTR